MAYARHATLSPEERQRIGSAPAGGPAKECEVTVTYPDGTQGQCRYERLGPAYHRFDYAYGDGARMSRRYWTKPVQDVNATARELAEGAFMDAVETERRDYFARVTEPTSGSRKPDPRKFRLDPKKAKQLGGMYALCMPIGRSLVMVGGPYRTITDANAALDAHGGTELVVACCNRMDRCWETPRYDPRPKEVA